MHADTIAMTLYHADITRRLHSDSIHGSERIVEVEMSYSQFAGAITSMNMGSRVPVTIRWTEKDGYIPECDMKHWNLFYTSQDKRSSTMFVIIVYCVIVIFMILYVG